MGVASLILGIVSIALCWFPGWGPILCLASGIVGIVLGALAKKNGGKGTGGLVCSIIGTALSFITMFTCGGWIVCAACFA